MFLSRKTFWYRFEISASKLRLLETTDLFLPFKLSLQEQAIAERALSQSQFIQGRPGTGKTSVIMHALLALEKQIAGILGGILVQAFWIVESKNSTGYYNKWFLLRFSLFSLWCVRIFMNRHIQINLWSISTSKENIYLAPSIPFEV